MELIRGGQRDCGQEIRGSAGGEERERLESLVRAGKSPGQLLTKARILLKADGSEAGEGWSDSAISVALDTSINNIAHLRHQLVEEGLEAVLKRKTQSEFCQQADFRRGGGGKVDRSDLLSGSRGVRSLEPAPARRESRRTEHRQAGQRQHDRPDAKKTRSNLTAIGNG